MTRKAKLYYKCFSNNTTTMMITMHHFQESDTSPIHTILAGKVLKSVTQESLGAIKAHFGVLDCKPLIIRSFNWTLFWILPVKHCIVLKIEMFLHHRSSEYMYIIPTLATVWQCTKYSQGVLTVDYLNHLPYIHNIQ